MQDVDHFDELGADSVEDQIVGMHAATDPMLLIAGNKRMPRFWTSVPEGSMFVSASSRIATGTVVTLAAGMLTWVFMRWSFKVVSVGRLADALFPPTAAPRSRPRA